MPGAENFFFVIKQSGLDFSSGILVGLGSCKVKLRVRETTSIVIF